MAAVVRGVLLDESVLVDCDDDGNPFLKSGVEILLRRLRFSDLQVGFCFHDDTPAEKTVLLEKTSTIYSFSCILVCKDVKESFKQLLKDWAIDEEICFYVTSKKESILYDIQNLNWMILYVGGEMDFTPSKEVIFINMMEELFITICCFTKKAMLRKSVATVGYVMKPSREEDFAKRGAFPMYPTENGLLFVPLILDIPLKLQLQEVDAVLHKATDEIICIEPQFLEGHHEGITFSKGICELERFILDHPHCCMIDPLHKIYPVLDRHRIQEVLLQLQNANDKNSCKLRAPHFLKIESFSDPNLRDQLVEANLTFPVIVKPQIACGVADAHNMALTFRFEDFGDLSVPLPAILQEYVDHGSCIFKFYVLGDNVFHAVKKSMPNADFLASLSENSGSKPIMFNSLKSLPVATEDQLIVGEAKSNKPALDVELVNCAANWLRKQLGLTIFGFDVVIQEGTGDHVIVDLNYLPSFKEVPNSDAIPAFWTAIRKAYEMTKSKFET